MPTPTRSGHTFQGWFTATSGGTQVTASTRMGTSNVTIYARWELIDTVKPTLTRVSVGGRTAAGGGQAGFDINYSFSDAESGIAGYYWGTEYPSASSAFTAFAGNSKSVSINNTPAGGYRADVVYYFAVKDNQGNITVDTFRGAIFMDYNSAYNSISITGYKHMIACSNSWTGFTVCRGSDNSQITSFTGNSGCTLDFDGSYDSIRIRWENCNLVIWN